MEGASELERHERAARNQALFRSVNEKMQDLNEAFGELAGTYAVVCECADTGCIETLEIAPDAYAAVREGASRFVVLPGHVAPELERVVAELPGYVVVEPLAPADLH